MLLQETCNVYTKGQVQRRSWTCWRTDTNQQNITSGNNSLLIHTSKISYLTHEIILQTLVVPVCSVTFQSSSSLLICWAVIWRALSCSCSDGIFTSQDRKHRSWIKGCHWELSQLISFRLLWLAHGCLNTQTHTHGNTLFENSLLSTDRVPHPQL